MVYGENKMLDFFATFFVVVALAVVYLVIEDLVRNSKDD
jgi:hypothetical protein